MPIFAVGAGSLTTLGLLLGAVALVALWGQTRRRMVGGVQRQTVSLGAGQALHVVELEGRRLVIGTGPGAAPRLLTELPVRSAEPRLYDEDARPRGEDARPRSGSWEGGAP